MLGNVHDDPNVSRMLSISDLEDDHFVCRLCCVRFPCRFVCRTREGGSRFGISTIQVALTFSWFFKPVRVLSTAFLTSRVVCYTRIVWCYLSPLVTAR